MSHKLDDTQNVLYVQFDKDSVEDRSLHDKVLDCQLRHDLKDIWVQESTTLLLQGSDQALQDAYEEISHFTGCEASLDCETSTAEHDVEEENEDFDFDVDKAYVLAIYAFNPSSLDTVKSNVAPLNLVTFFTEHATADGAAEKDIYDKLDNLDSCSFGYLEDETKLTILIVGYEQDIDTVQAHFQDSYATFKKSYQDHLQGVQPWTYRPGSPAERFLH